MGSPEITAGVSETEADSSDAAVGTAPKRVLVVMSTAGVVSCALPDEGAVTIGRGDDCDVKLEDKKASRRHATIRLGPRCSIEDLGSMNGTRVGDRRLAAREATELHTGEMIAIGATALVLQLAAEHAPPVRLWSVGAFAQRFEEERVKAAASQGPFALLSVTLADDATSLASTLSSRAAQGAGRAEAIEQSLRECLRPTDVVGSIGPGAYEILLVATAPEEAAGIGSLLRRHLRERGIGVEMRIACAPRDGTTRDALLDGGRAAADEPRAGEPEIDERLVPDVDRVAGSDISVLVLGETGVGKEVLARAIHARSRRAARPLVCINCAALSESLLESELFGHEKGAFTGALSAKEGLLESAKGGTVFLDELGEMPLSLQAKLLRVIEQREVVRVGAVRPRPIDVRFVAATNRDLPAEIEAGRFRRDLYFRLEGFKIVIPPLRERRGEIAKLARAFVRRACEEARRRTVPRLSAEVVEVLERHPWPGNIRELRNVMERAVILTSGDVIALESLPTEMMARTSAAASKVRRDVAAPSRATVAPQAPGDESPPDSDATFQGEQLGEVLAREQRQERGDTGDRARIVAALKACNGNQTKAAELLGISRRTLVYRLSEYGLPRPRRKDPDDL